MSVNSIGVFNNEKNFTVSASGLDEKTNVVLQELFYIQDNKNLLDYVHKFIKRSQLTTDEAITIIKDLKVLLEGKLKGWSLCDIDHSFILENYRINLNDLFDFDSIPKRKIDAKMFVLDSVEASFGINKIVLELLLKYAINKEKKLYNKVLSTIQKKDLSDPNNFLFVNFQSERFTKNTLSISFKLSPLTLIAMSDDQRFNDYSLIDLNPQQQKIFTRYPEGQKDFTIINGFHPLDLGVFLNDNLFKIVQSKKDVPSSIRESRLLIASAQEALEQKNIHFFNQSQNCFNFFDFKGLDKVLQLAFTCKTPLKPVEILLKCAFNKTIKESYFNFLEHCCQFKKISFTKFLNHLTYWIPSLLRKTKEFNYILNVVQNHNSAHELVYLIARQSPSIARFLDVLDKTLGVSAYAKDYNIHSSSNNVNQSKNINQFVLFSEILKFVSEATVTSTSQNLDVTAKELSSTPIQTIFYTSMPTPDELDLNQFQFAMEKVEEEGKIKLPSVEEQEKAFAALIEEYGGQDLFEGGIDEQGFFKLAFEESDNGPLLPKIELENTVEIKEAFSVDQIFPVETLAVNSNDLSVISAELYQFLNNKNWFQKISGILAKKLYHDNYQGIWQFDLETFDEKELKSVLGDLKSFYNKSIDKLHAKKMIKKVVEFLGFYNSQGNDLKTFSVLRKNIIPTSATIISSQSSYLSQNMRLQTCQTFCDVKMRELAYILKHSQFHNVKTPEVKPCFMLSQDNEKAMVHLLLADFDNQGRLIGFFNDINKLGPSLLKSLINDPLNFSSEEDSLTTTLTISQLGLIKESLLAQKQDPAFILVKRSALRFFNENTNPLEEHEEPVSLQDDVTEDMIEDETLELIHEEETFSEPSEEIQVRKRKYVFDQEKKTQPIKKPKKGGDASGSLRIEKPYHDLTLAQAFQMSQEPQGQSENGIIKHPTIQPMELEDFQFENFWQQETVESVQKIEHRLKSTSLALTVINQEKMLDYPILNKLAEVSPLDLEPQPIFNRFLKKYQINEVGKLLNYAHAGIGRVLAFQMGLGKTYTAGEFIAHRLAKFQEGVHVIAMPKSLLAQFGHQLFISLSEACLTAWEAALKTKSKEFIDIHAEQFLTTFKHFLERKQDAPDKQVLAMYLCVFGLLPDRTIFGKIKISSEIIGEIVCEHLNRIKHHPEFKARVQECLKDPSNDIHLKHLKNKLIQGDWREADVKAFFWDVKRFQLKIAGKLLYLHPARSPLGDSQDFSVPFLENLMHFSSNYISICSSQKDLKESLSKKSHHPLILLATAGQLKKLELDTNALPWHTFMLDEAQHAHNPGTTKYKLYAKLTRQLRKLYPDISLTMITATPFENSYSEIWSLLQLANPENFDGENLKALNKLLEKTQHEMKRYCRNPMGDTTKLVELTLKSFSHFYYFKKIVLNPLIAPLKMTDEQVRQAWGDNIPKREDLAIPIKLKPEIEQIITQAENKFKNEKSSPLPYEHTINRTLLHPRLGNESIKNGSEEARNFIKKVQEQDLSKTFDESPLLSIFANPIIHKIFKNHEKAIVFVDYLTTAEAVAIVAKKMHAYLNVPNKNPDKCVKIYSGEIDTELQKKHIAWFKKSSKTPKAKLLVLMNKVGGVGLNLQEAKYIIKLKSSWNPFGDEQMIARGIRIGDREVHQVIVPAFNIHLEEHVKLIREKKIKWDNYLWDQVSASEEYKNWLDVLECVCKHDLFNGKKEVDPEALAQLHRFFEILAVQHLESVEHIIKKVNKKPTTTSPKDLSPIAQTPSPIPSTDHPIQIISEKPHGLPNIGNSCYINAALQTLVNTTWLNEKGDVQEFNLNKIFSSVETEKMAAYRQLKENIFKSGHPEFLTSPHEQKDVAAFFEAALDLLQYSFLDQTTIVRKSDNNLLEFPKTANQQKILSLPLKKSLSFQEIFAKEFMQEEIQELANSFYLDDAGIPRKCERGYTTRNLCGTVQPILVTQLKRFTAEDGELAKDETEVAIADELDIKQAYRVDHPLKYQLKGFIVHVGSSLRSGHYIAYVNKNNVWYCCNDTHISIADKSSVEEAKKKSYVCVWERTEVEKLVIPPRHHENTVNTQPISGAHLDNLSYFDMPAANKEDLKSFEEALKLGELSHKGAGDATVKTLIGDLMLNRTASQAGAAFDQLQLQANGDVKTIMQNYQILVYDAENQLVNSINETHLPKIRIRQKKFHQDDKIHYKFNLIVRLRK